MSVGLRVGKNRCVMRVCNWCDDIQRRGYVTGWVRRVAQGAYVCDCGCV
jgi:hypothetical protein